MLFIDPNLIIKTKMSTSDLINYVQKFISINNRYPTKGYSLEETKIVNRICTQKFNHRFTTSELELLDYLYREYGKKGDWLNPSQLIACLRDYINENEFYPDTTYRSGIWGNKLCKRVSAALRNKRFTLDEEQEILYYQSFYLKKHLTTEQLFNTLKQFVETNNKYPSQSGNKMEKKLACRVNAQLSNDNFSSNHKIQILEWKNRLLNKPVPVDIIINNIKDYLNIHQKLPIRYGTLAEKTLYHQYKNVLARNLTDSQSKELTFIKEYYGFREYKTNTNKLLKNLKDFIKFHNHYPSNGSIFESKLYNKIQNSIKRNNFNYDQLEIIQNLQIEYNNTYIKNRKLYNESISFLQQYHRLPNVKIEHEKSLRLRLNYAYKKKKFSKSELNEIDNLKRDYNINKNIIEPQNLLNCLQQLINKIGYYPNERGTSEEVKICCSIRYNEKKGYLTEDDKKNILMLKSRFTKTTKHSYLSFNVEQILNKLNLPYIWDHKICGAEVKVNHKRISFRFDYIIDLSHNGTTFSILKMVEDPIAKTNNHIVIIEADGEQHFKPSYFGSNKSAQLKYGSKENAKQKCFAKQHQYDIAKTIFCECNNIPLLRIKYTQISIAENMINDLINNPNKYIHSHNTYTN